MIPNWLTATWGEIFSGRSGEPDETGEIQTAEMKRRVFEAQLAKASCEGLTMDEANAMVRSIKAWPLQGELFWWLHEYDAQEWQGVKQLGGCPDETFTPAIVTDTQVALAVEQERARASRWMMITGAATLGVVAAAVWALWPRKRSRRGRR